MPAYLIVFRETPVRDAAEIQAYQSKVRGAPSHGMTPRVIYGDVHAVEGVPPDGVVMIEFPDVATARAWYESPEYQAAIPHRLKAAEWRMIIVEGL